MKVGFLLLHPFSFEKTKSLGTTVRVKELAVNLSTMGVEPYVFTPYEGNYQTPDGICVIHLNNLWRKLGLSSIIYNLSRTIYFNKILQAIFIRWYIKKALRKFPEPFFNLVETVNEYEIDVLQAVQDNAALLILGVKDKLGIPCTVDLHSIWSEELVATGTIKRQSEEFKILQAMERRILQNIDLVEVIGEEMYRYVVSNYQISPRKVVIIKQGGTSTINEVPTRPLPLKVVYSGIVSYRKNFKLFLDAIPFISYKKPNTYFYATKKGDLVKRASSYVKKRNIRSLRWYWFQHQNQLYNFLKQCHVGVITNEKSIANKMDMPSKFFDYMSLGVPVVTNYIGGWTDIVEQYQVGLTTKSTPKSLAEGILTLLENPKLAHECGENGIKLVRERFNWNLSASVLYQKYLALTR